jgi:multiple sugar transport system ATP-binding protein
LRGKEKPLQSLDIQGVNKNYGDVQILHDINLHVEAGEFVVFVGPSGCGKSTLLRLICGLDDVSSGVIAIDGEIVNDVPPSKRGIAMVFQSYALYPHMTVAQNMAYALKLAGTPKAEIKARVAAAAEILHLTELLARKPRQLSGGQRQRVAIGRAIVREPRIFLFDEPLSNLDAALRVEMRIEIAKLKQRLGATMVYVTHDQVEAMTLADKIVVLNRGRIEQVGGPMDLYHFPKNRFVAGFIGSPKMNFLACADLVETAEGPRARLKGGGSVVIAPAAGHVTPAEIGLRPEDLTVTEAANADLVGRVAMTERLGSDTFAYVELAGGDTVLARLPGRAALRQGAQVGLAVEPGNVHLFDAAGVAIARRAVAPAVAVA